MDNQVLYKYQIIISNTPRYETVLTITIEPKQIKQWLILKEISIDSDPGKYSHIIPSTSDNIQRNYTSYQQNEIIFPG